jgi:hypothetical protein
MSRTAKPRRALAGVADIAIPVQRTCGTIYDMQRVEVLARHLDCTVWRTPCCGRQADDRGESGWTRRQDYRRLTAQEVEAYSRGWSPMDIYGRSHPVRWVQ